MTKNGFIAKIRIEPKSLDHNWFSITLFLRMGMMAIIAIIIAQPLNVYLFESQISTHLENYKTKQFSGFLFRNDSSLVSEFSKEFRFALNTTNNPNSELVSAVLRKITLDSIYLAQSNDLRKSIDKPKTIFKFSNENATSEYTILRESTKKYIESDASILGLLGKNGTFVNSFLYFQFKKYIQNKNTSRDNFIKTAQRSNFYITKIRLLLKYSYLTNLLTIIVFLIFIIPVILKFRIRKSTSYYQFKSKFETDFVLKEYLKFKFEYVKVLDAKLIEVNNQIISRLNQELVKLEKFNRTAAIDFKSQVENDLSGSQISFYEHWADAPFNTFSKREALFKLKQADLLKVIYDKGC